MFPKFRKLKEKFKFLLLRMLLTFFESLLSTKSVFLYKLILKISGVFAQNVFDKSMWVLRFGKRSGQETS